MLSLESGCTNSSQVLRDIISADEKTELTLAYTKAELHDLCNFITVVRSWSDDDTMYVVGALAAAAAAAAANAV